MTQKTEIVTIHGVPGCGKSSTILELLNQAYFTSYQTLSTGKIAREIAKKYGFLDKDFNSFPEHARLNKIPYDDLIDQHLKDSAKESKLLVDCRLGYYFIPNSFKVLLEIDLEEAAKRVFKSTQRPDSSRFRKGVELKTVELELRQREKNDWQKYWDLYKTSYIDRNNYDLIIDSGKLGLPFVVSEITNAYLAWLKN